MPNQYSNVAVTTSLSSGANAVDTTIHVAATTGFPVSTPYTLVLDYGTASEELVSVTGVAGLDLTVTRGFDGTSATTHSTGAAVQHVHSAKDFKDSRDHEAATAAHGATGAVVGTTNSQALTNKDLSSGTNTFPASLATDAEVATAVSTGVSTHAAVTETHGATGAVVGTTNTQTLTNKTLTSPVLEAPTVTGVGEDRVVFKTADQSVTSSATRIADTDLIFSVVAGAKYVFEVNLFVNGPGGDINTALDGPALTYLVYGDSLFTAANFVSSAYNTANGTLRHFQGFIECSASGNVSIMWAQNVSHATPTTVLKGSFLRVRRVA